MEVYDVVIVGGGTAGLYLARELGRMKRKTLVLERKDDLFNFTFNTLGSFINLEQFGLTENVVAQRMDHAILYSKNVQRQISGRGYILDKKVLHQELFASIDTDYVKFHLGVRVNQITSDENTGYKAVTDKKGNSYQGKIFVDASGTIGVLSKQVGLQSKKPKLATGVEYNVKYFGDPNTGHLFVGKQYQGGYGWIFPLKDQRAILGFGSYDGSVVKDLKPRLNAILEIPVIKKLVEKDNEQVEGGSIPLTPVLEKFVIDNLICVGDSVSQVNPIAGEGYKFIFESAAMASLAINQTLENNDLSCLSQYESDWKNRFSKSYKRAKFSQDKLFRYSKNDYLMDFFLVMAKLRSNDSLVRSLSGEFDSFKG